MKLLDLMRTSTEHLKNAGIDEPSANAELLVLHAAEVNRVTAYSDNPEITDEKKARINEFLKRRINREPLQYILGEVHFLGLRLTVGKGVLIPRPETEILAQEAIKTIKSEIVKVRSNKTTSRVTVHSSLKVLDLCCGSGCISLSIGKEFPEAEVIGTDISDTALDYAQKNAAMHGIRNIAFLKGSLYQPLRENMLFDIIISNPPYIRTSDMKSLQPEIHSWEPIEALDGGSDGLNFYRKIFTEAGRYLTANGIMLLELGYNQASPVKEIAEHAGFTNIVTIKDYAGIERIIKAYT